MIRFKTCCCQLVSTYRRPILCQQRKQERAKRVSLVTKAMIHGIYWWILEPRHWKEQQNNSDNKSILFQLDDMRVEVSRREQEIMQMATKMKTLEEQHQDYQKHIAVLKESLCAKEEHYTMLQTDVSSAHHMANRKVKPGGLKAPRISRCSAPKATLPQLPAATLCNNLAFLLKFETFSIQALKLFC